MAITRSQQAKQLLALGGRIGFQGGGKDASQDDFGGGVGKGEGGGSTPREKGIMSRGKGPKGTTGDIRDFQDTGPDDRSNAIQNYTQSLVRQGYSPRQINQMFNRPNFFQRMVRNPFVRTGLYALNPVVGKFAARDVLKGIDVARNIKSIYDNPTLEVPETFFDEDKEVDTNLDKDKEVDTNLDEDKEVDTNLEDLAEGVRNMDKVMERQKEKSQADVLEELGLKMNMGGRVDLAEGGMPYEGGIMDLESARQMYGLGKLVRKVTKTVKKIAKSPIGKAAMLYFAPALIPGGASTLGGVFQNMGGLGGLKTKFLGSAGKFITQAKGTPLERRILSGASEGILGRLGLTSGFGGGLTTSGVSAAITATSLLPLLGIGTGDESEEEAQAILDNSGIDIDRLRNDSVYREATLGRRFKADGGRIEYQKGGPAKEPVAKKVMPLLDLDGQEMDFRQDGGFVPIGRMEKADDVPARLSKNEFVFTAEAVRNAGDGDVDKGAEVMYNMMKNLEAGGEVSEESQGLEGARKMFQTSQRLEEVL